MTLNLKISTATGTVGLYRLRRVFPSKAFLLW